MILKLFLKTGDPQINYLLEQGKFDHLTAIDDKGEIKLEPKNFQLYQNYPNPFNPSTTFKWNLSKPGKVTLKIFDPLGNEIETLIDGYYDSGLHSKFFILNSKLSSGVYFYRLSTQNYSETKSMVLLK
jgi:hypothetical protein